MLLKVSLTLPSKWFISYSRTRSNYQIKSERQIILIKKIRSVICVSDPAVPAFLENSIDSLAEEYHSLCVVCCLHGFYRKCRDWLAGTPHLIVTLRNEGKKYCKLIWYLSHALYKIALENRKNDLASVSFEMLHKSL